MNRLLWITVTALVLAAGIYYVRVDVKAEPTKLTFATASRGDVVATVDATGTLLPLDTVELGSQVSGTIASIGADFNHVVKRGQVIATLDQALFQSQVEQARATTTRLKSAVDQAQVQLEDAQLKAKRADQLAAAQLLAQQDVDTARSTARVAEAGLIGARAQLEQAEGALTQARVNLSHTVITAPTDGIVLSRNVEVGQTVSAGLQAPVLFVIARDLSKLELQARVDESDIGGIEPGHPVTFTVDAYPRQTFAGTVRLVRLQPVTVQNVVTYTTVIDVPNPTGVLKPGMTSTASIETERADDVLRVPVAALRFTPTAELLTEFASDVTADGDGAARAPAVWQLVDGRMQRVAVKTSMSDGSTAAVTGGTLNDGAQVITGVVRAEGTAATAAPSASPLMPTMPRRQGGTGGSGRQGR